MTLLESAVDARTGQSQRIFRVEDLVKIYGPQLGRRRHHAGSSAGCGLGGRPTPLTSTNTDERQVGEDTHKVWWVVRSTVSAQVSPRTRIVASLPTLASSRSGECGDGLDEPDVDDCELGE